MKWYPEYKDSGAEWLGEVPAHWEMMRMRRLFEIKKRIARSDNFDVLSITQEGIKKKDIDSNEGQIANDYSTYQLVFRNDFAMNGMDLLTGYVDISPFDGITSPDYRVFCLRESSRAFDRYLLYLLQMGYKQKIFYAFGQGASQLGRWRLPTDEFNNFLLPLPPIGEQIAIASFLDRETGKIDALLAEQERLIGLLKEKRQGVISHAVTKGLDPNAPMKDSGVEWLGQLPAHWDVLPLKRDLAFLTSGSRGWAEHYSDDGAIFVRIGNLTRDTTDLDLTDIQRVNVPTGSEGERTRIEPGDVLFSITAYLGSVAVVPDGMEAAFVSQHVALARLRRKYVLPKWVGTVVLSSVGKTYLEAQGYGGTKIQLALDDVANVLVTVPPIEEQVEILHRLLAETIKMDELIAEAQRAIALLQERRSALISAAVTGKIDVRGLVPQTAEAA